MQDSYPGECADSSGRSGLGTAQGGTSNSDSRVDNSHDLELSSSELRKLRNRQKQQRCRARRKAAEQALQDKVASVERDLLQGKQAVAVKDAEKKTLRSRIGDLLLQLESVREEVSNCLHPPAHAAAHPSAGPPRLQAPSRSDRGADIKLGYDAWFERSSLQRSNPHWAEAGPSAASTSSWGEPCAIFVARDQPGVRKHRRYVSVSRVDKAQPYLVALTSYRRRVAEELGCQMHDILWLLESELYPELTKHGAMTSMMETPECVAKLTSLWLANSIETAALLAILRNLEKLRDGTSPSAIQAPSVIICDNSPTPAALSAGTPSSSSEPWLRGVASDADFLSHTQASYEAGSSTRSRGDSADATGTAVSDDAESTWVFDSVQNTDDGGDGVEALVRNMHTMLLRDSKPKKRGGVDFGSTSTADDAWTRLEGTIRQVFANIFLAYVPMMRPVDTVRLCKRLQTSFGSNAQRAATGAAGPQEVTAARSFASVFAACNAVAHAVLLDVRQKPVVPKLPSSVEEIKSSIDATLSRLAASRYEWDLLYEALSLDATSRTISLAQWAHPITLGYAEFEKVNLAMWHILELTAEQKSAVSAVWAEHRRRQQESVASFDDLARQLIYFPSVADLDVSTMPSLMRFAEEMRKRDIARTSQLTQHDEDGGPSLPPPSLDPYKDRKLSLREPWRSDLPAGVVGDQTGQSLQANKRPDWMRDLLGVCPEATSFAGQLLGELCEVQRLKHRQYLTFLCRFTDCLTTKQNALYLTGMLPFTADSFRIAGMASTDVCNKRVYGRPAICR